MSFHLQQNKKESGRRVDPTVALRHE